MSRVIVGCVLLAAVVTTLSITDAATREPAGESATVTATTGSCADLRGHNALQSAHTQRLFPDL